MKTRHLLAVCLIPVLALVTASGCGYSTRSLLPEGLDSIHVDNFENRIDPTREVSNRRMSYIYSPGLENQVTRAVIDGFIFDRHLSIDRAGEAALTLKGALVDYRLYPLSYDRGDDIEEYRVEVLVDLELYNNRTGKTMWTETNFMGQANYNIKGPDRLTDAQARAKAVNDLARRVVERVVEAW